jgi:hypothetical protein
MAILKDQQVLFDGHRLTTRLSALSLDYGAETLDITTLNSNTRINTAGLKTAGVQIDGYYSAPLTDGPLMQSVGVADKPFTVLNSSTEGSVAFSLKMMTGDYTPFQSSVGDVHSFSAGGASTGELVRGVLMDYKTGVSNAGDGTPRELGAIAAGKKLYAVLHVWKLEGSSPELDIEIESDGTDSDFLDDTTRVTFATMTAPGSQWIELPGPITDEWWRVVRMVDGTGLDIDYSVVLAIQ